MMDEIVEDFINVVNEQITEQDRKEDRVIEIVTKVWVIMLLNRTAVSELLEMAGLEVEVTEVQSVEAFVTNVINVLREMQLKKLKRVVEEDSDHMIDKALLSSISFSLSMRFL